MLKRLADQKAPIGNPPPSGAIEMASGKRRVRLLMVQKQSSGKTQCDNGHIAHHPIAGATGVYRIALLSLKEFRCGWMNATLAEYLPA